MVSYYAKSQSLLPAYRLGRERVVGRRAFRRGRTYFFDRVIGQNERDFESVNIEKQISSAINEHVKNLVGKLREKINKSLPSAELLATLVPLPERFADKIVFVQEDIIPEYYFHKHSSSLILPITTSSFCIISKTREDASQLIEFIRSEFEKLNEVTKDFGVQLTEFLTGRSYQESIVRTTEHIQNIKYQEPKNELEKEVITFCEQLTSSFLPNVEIAFTEPNEVHEYDVFMGITGNVKRILEPTNYESLKDQLPTGENLKSQIVLKTLDKAQRLGARSAVIAKGFPESVFNDLKKIAESRGVILLGETNYKDVIPKIFFSDIVSAYRQVSEPRYVPF